MKVGVVGAGHLGLVTAAGLTTLGHTVTCVDSDDQWLERLTGGIAPFVEPELSGLLAAARADAQLQFSDRISDAVERSQVILLCFDVNARSDAEADLALVREVAIGIGETLGDDSPVVATRGAYPVGTSALVREWIAEGGRRDEGTRGRRDEGTTWEESASSPSVVPSSRRPLVASSPRRVVPSSRRPLVASSPCPVAVNPAFLRKGSAIRDMLSPDRIVVGVDDDRATDLMRELYAPLCRRTEGSGSDIPFVTTDRTSAEVMSLAGSAFLATKLSYINEIANICARVGARVEDVAHGIGLDARIGRRGLDAGVGWGGNSLGRDLATLSRLARDYGAPVRLLAATEAVNWRQRQWVVRTLQSRLKALKGKRIGLLGLAFKPFTDELCDAPAIDLAKRLLRLGARVRALDPVAGPRAASVLPELVIVRDAAELADGADALVLVTDWFAFHNIDFEAVRGRMRRPILIDGRNALDATRLRAMGFDVIGVGQ